MTHLCQPFPLRARAHSSSLPRLSSALSADPWHSFLWARGILLQPLPGQYNSFACSHWRGLVLLKSLPISECCYFLANQNIINFLEGNVEKQIYRFKSGKKLEITYHFKEKSSLVKVAQQVGSRIKRKIFMCVISCGKLLNILYFQCVYSFRNHNRNIKQAFTRCKQISFTCQLNLQEQLLDFEK